VLGLPRVAREPLSQTLGGGDGNAKRNASRADDAHCDRRLCVADGLGEGDNLFRRH
jgi:hypothetical protein